MATYNYIHAVWKNGPNVVSDAPSWVIDTIERVVPVWMFAHERTFSGIQFDLASRLMLGVFVSPGAFETEGLLEDAREGSFIHVFASDHPDCVVLSPDQARVRFESVYGGPLSDAALRQERNYVLLEFPYHRELATDLFVPKDLVEGGVGLPSERAFADPAGRVAEPAAFRASPDADPTESQRSLSSELLRGATMREVDSGAPHLMDQGLSYQEVLARLSGSDRIVDAPTPAASMPALLPEPVDVPRTQSKERSTSLLRGRTASQEVDAPDLVLDEVLTYRETIERLAPRAPTPGAPYESARAVAGDTTAVPVTPPIERAPHAEFTRTSGLLDHSAEQREAGARPETLLDQGLSYAEVVARLSRKALEESAVLDSEAPLESAPRQAQTAEMQSAPVVELELSPTRAPAATPALNPAALASPLADGESRSTWGLRELVSAAAVLLVAFVAGLLLMRGRSELPASTAALPPVASSAVAGEVAPVVAPTPVVEIAPIEANPAAVSPDLVVAIESGSAAAFDSPEVSEPQAVIAPATPALEVAAVAVRERTLREVPAVETVEAAQEVAVVEVVEIIAPVERVEVAVARPEPVPLPPVAVSAVEALPIDIVASEPASAFAELETVELPPVSAAPSVEEAEESASAGVEAQPEAPAPEKRRSLKRRKLIGQMQRAR